MKVTTAMYTMKRGGSYDRFKMMIESFLEKQWEVHCLSLSPIQIEHSCFHNHRTITPFRIRGGLGTKFVVLFLFPFYSLLIGWREKIDLFVAFGSLYAFLLAIPKWILKKPMVTLIRGDSTIGLNIRKSNKFLLCLNRVVEYLGLLFSDRIITVNTAIQREIVKAIGEKKKTEVKVLFNNVPPIPISFHGEILKTRTQWGIPEEAKVLVTAGVINPGKNIEIVIKSLARIGMNKLFLLIVGDGSAKRDFQYQNYLRELAETLGLARQVIFTGWLEKEKLWRIFRASDLFVLPSKSEGMPNVMLEALGIGLPCMGGRIPGITDILENEKLMFDPSDEKAVTEKIRDFFCDVQYSNDIIRLCQDRKKFFVFDWKEKVFQMVTEGSM